MLGNRPDTDKRSFMRLPHNLSIRTETLDKTRKTIVPNLALNQLPKSSFLKWIKNPYGLLASLPVAVAFPNYVNAQETASSFSLLQHSNILQFSIFSGAMGIALFSAFWLIRERKKIFTENSRLSDVNSTLRARLDHSESLINVEDQRLLVWNGPSGEPKIHGSLPAGSSVPSNEQHFLNFKDWVSADSYFSFNKAIHELRENAESFDQIITTKGQGIIEAQGRFSGSHAYVRFRELSSEREELATLKSEHVQLSNRYLAIESLFEELPFPVWLNNPDGDILWVNSAYTQALELSQPIEAIQSNADLLDADYRKEVSAAEEKQELYQKVIPVTVKSDRTKLEVFSLKSEYGSAGIAFDRSAFEEARQQLDEVNKGHARMLDQIDTAVAIFDKSQHLIFWNAAFQKLWELDATYLDANPSNEDLLDNIRDKEILPFVPDWRVWREDQLRVYTAVEPSEEWWHLLNGQTLRINVSPRTEGGVNWIFQNVTEQLALESNNKSLVRMQGETLDHLKEAVAVFGSDGKLHLFNPALEELWSKMDMEVVEGLHIATIIDHWTASMNNPSDLENILGRITGFDGQRTNVSGRLELNDGDTFEYAIVPLPEGQSMLTLTNITANVKFESALKERAEALEASDQLKSKFIQHVSYELRAPLTTILGFTEILTSKAIGELNEKQDMYISYIYESADELSSIVCDILDLASIDAGTINLKFVSVNLASIITRVLESHSEEMSERKLNADVNIDSDSVDIVADQIRMTQIINNLISNAISFSPNGGTISIQVKNEDEHHVLFVSDQGDGVPEEQRDIIFERFETRTPNGTRRGTGLGLSVVRSFIELHGGSVAVINQEGPGACFECRIPKNPQPVEMPANGSYISISSA